MSHRVLQGPGFADMMVKRKTKPNNFLDRIQSLVKWNEIERLLSPLHSAVEGAPSYPPLCMFKMLLLQQWYGLSDPGTEEAVNDRLSFRRFCGFSLSESIPDYSTLCRFRNELGEHALGEALFDSFNAQLDSLGLVLKEGTLVDATVVEANVQKPTGGQVSQRDLDAGWTKKRGEYHFGYKASIGVDEGSDIIRKAKLTSADVHDSLVTYEVIVGDEQSVYADKAYHSQDFRKKLREAGIEDKVMYRAAKGRELLDWQKWFNKAVSKTRAGVERGFGNIKRDYGYTRVRYLGLKKNQNHLHLLAMAINMRKALNLVT